MGRHESGCKEEGLRGPKGRGLHQRAEDPSRTAVSESKGPPSALPSASFWMSQEKLEIDF